MKILAIDSSSLVATVAIVNDDILTAEYTINYKKTHSQTLLPMIDEMCRMTGLDMNTIDAIAITSGPGSFTGLRIGSATAKGIGLALDKPVIGIPTVDAMAYNLYGTDKYICPIMDAKRNQVYTGIYKFENGKFSIIHEQCAIAIDQLISILEDLGDSVIFLGDGVPVYKKYIDDYLKLEHFYAPAHVNRQRAGAVAVLAEQYFADGKIENSRDYKPDYLRLSQAERERNERENGNK